MLMLNLSFDSKKSEVIKVKRFIGWSAIEPKAPRQQLGEAKDLIPGREKNVKNISMDLSARSEGTKKDWPNPFPLVVF